ncbi:carbohydrate kinase family protein [Paucibacter sp. APW11]|uniref:Carbohydrate kinase family protein n=1 Tax=Roseateles aquae TaxID=3077235 RepID=A0ABU3PE01_9BURK|nr:carbohydrate kinase family protein [Paucibacter sp. APW11]MDT9000121.1 carbohydrate kinase family protein [Paucibacter sp. APW11]
MDRAHPHLSIVGDLGVDLVMGSIAEWPQVGTELILPRSEMRAGGSGANTALVMRHLGRPVQLIAAVGDDDFGRWLAAQLHGVQADLQTCRSSTTLSVGLMHACGERNFFTTQGHLELMDAAHVRARWQAQPAPRSIALFTGSFLLPGLRAQYAELLREAAQNGYQVALDTGWPSQGWSEALRAELRPWLAHVDHLLINETEALHLAASTELDAAMRHIATLLKPGASLVVKVGAKGAIGLSAGQRIEQGAVPAQVFDSIGAGDSFNAGYLAARLQGADLAQALASGCRVAQAVLARFPRATIAPGELAACLQPAAFNEVAA